MSLPTSIDALKSTIGARGGLARANRFAIYMSYPGGPGLLNINPLSALSNIVNTGFSMKSFINDPRDIFILCESVQIPGRRITTMEQFHTHFSVKKPYSMIVDEVTFTFLLTNDYFIRRYFDHWQEQIIGTEDSPRVGYREDYASDVIIQQLSPGNDIVPGYQVKLINAYPISVGAIELSNSAENSVLQVTITLTFDNWKSTGIIEGVQDLLSTGGQFISNTINRFL